MEKILIEKYLNVLKVAYPTKPLPHVFFERNWYYICDATLARFEAHDIENMCNNLNTKIKWKYNESPITP